MDGKKAFKDWHWGIDPVSTVKIQTPSVLVNPKDKKKWENMKLVECGRLVEIHYTPFNQSARKKDQIIRLDEKNSNECHLCFDMEHPHQRLYFILNNDTKNRMKREIMKGNPYDSMDLGELSTLTGGRHGVKNDYEKIQVQPVGVMTNVVYATEKQGDGYSFYIHALGEESGIRPTLAMSSDGNLWFAGGNYTSKIQGITD